MFGADGIDQLARGSESDDFAVIHDGHAVAESLGFIHVMGGEQDGAAGELELLDEFPELAAGLRIEAGGGFVEEQEVGVADKRARQREALLLAAGEVAHAGFGLLVELHQADRLERSGSLLEEAAE